MKKVVGIIIIIISLILIGMGVLSILQDNDKNAIILNSAKSKVLKIKNKIEKNKVYIGPDPLSKLEGDGYYYYSFDEDDTLGYVLIHKYYAEGNTLKYDYGVYIIDTRNNIYIPLTKSTNLTKSVIKNNSTNKKTNPTGTKDDSWKDIDGKTYYLNNVENENNKKEKLATEATIK